MLVASSKSLFTCFLLLQLLTRWAASSVGILNTLAFATPLVAQLWSALQGSGCVRALTRQAAALFVADAKPSPLSAVKSINSSTKSVLHDVGSIPGEWARLVLLFSTVYQHLLITQDDEEFHAEQLFSKSDQSGLVVFLRCLLFRLYWSEWSLEPEVKRLRQNICRLFQQLRDRYSRREFTATQNWLMTDIALDIFEKELNEADKMQLEPNLSGDLSCSMRRVVAILNDLPFVLPFDARVRLFYSYMDRDQKQLEERTFFCLCLFRSFFVRCLNV
jgi:hypothetical protein